MTVEKIYKEFSLYKITSFCITFRLYCSWWH